MTVLKLVLVHSGLLGCAWRSSRPGGPRASRVLFGATVCSRVPARHCNGQLTHSRRSRGRLWARGGARGPVSRAFECGSARLGGVRGVLCTEHLPELSRNKFPCNENTKFSGRSALMDLVSAAAAAAAAAAGPVGCCGGACRRQRLRLWCQSLSAIGGGGCGRCRR